MSKPTIGTTTTEKGKYKRLYKTLGKVLFSKLNKSQRDFMANTCGSIYLGKNPKIIYEE